MGIEVVLLISVWKEVVAELGYRLNWTVTGKEKYAVHIICVGLGSVCCNSISKAFSGVVFMTPL